MTTAARLYTGNVGFNWRSANLSNRSDGFFESRRPYDLANIFAKTEHRNVSTSMKTLVGDKGVNPRTTQDDSVSWLQISNPSHMMKTSSASKLSYGWIEWHTGTSEYVHTWGTGGGLFNIDSSDGGSGYFLPNVVGMTFTWRRVGYWSNRYVGSRYFGMNYYSPSRRIWRTVRFNTSSNIISGGNKDYYSAEGDRWQSRGGDLSNLSGGKEDWDQVYEDTNKWNPISASLSEEAATKVIEEDWLWGGVWFECQTEGKAGKANGQRRVDITDVQPIFGPYVADGVLGPRIILPAPTLRTNGPADKNYMTRGMYLRG